MERDRNGPHPRRVAPTVAEIEIRKRRRRRRRRRRALGCLAVLVAAVVVLTRMDTQVRTAVGAVGVGGGSFPVAEVAGIGRAHV